ncbi:dTDP-4-dehydrorhamnose reductase [Phytoactinopolyspora halotolerans]|uniref:dTDP-4-dehydrorhamnose reductase n=1 Tax=Phytoactinopolyspora halotolerans TaxID=1981512 RepID=A0A6L9S4C4_9ACTN|nr:dTDP-4-dehydrorhamnose reductase [Phytoactinopolyspora halotolerans]NED99630.1 dTDP-4-dehydrorhamnose reductase [Phytoactinopolyspora halotolerans]
MIRWLVTGAGGMLGHDLLALLPADAVTAPTHRELDVTDADTVHDAVRGHDVVAHLAAWTDVDGAESDPDGAMSVNGTGTANVARACRTHGARLVHISTDYVFDGTAREPYPEDEPVDPVSAYGRSKAAAERAVREHLPDAGIILRTAWLYGEHGKNFVATMRHLAETRDHVDVVDDQQGQPTWTRDLAGRIVEVVRADAPGGIYHATNAGATTWYELARAVFAALGHDPERVRPTTSDRFVRPAPRPAYSVLSHDGWARASLPPMRHWRDAFDDAARTLLRTP